MSDRTTADGPTSDPGLDHAPGPGPDVSSHAGSASPSDAADLSAKATAIRHNTDLLPSMAEIDAANDPAAAAETTFYRPQIVADDATLDGGARGPVVAKPVQSPAPGGFEVLRPTVFLVSLLAVLVTLTPFMDRSGKALLSTLDIGSRLNQLFFPALFVVVVFAVGLNNMRSVGGLLRWPYLAFALWLLPAVYFSLDPLLSARRTVFFVTQVAIACLAVLLPRSERQLAWLLVTVAAVVLIMSYGGVVGLPHLAIHQPTDAIEVDLAGDWRGIFKHKNEAGAVMAMMVFVGLYAMRRLNPVVGVAIAVPAAAFLVMSGSKSSMILLPLALLLAFLVERCRTTTTRAVVALSLLVAFNIATLGSSFPGPIRDTLSKAMPDVTFTGRTDLWRFAIEHVAQRPLVGYGIGAFWRTAATMYKDREEAEPGDMSGWVAELGTDSHNGYLDVAVSTGLPGLLFLLLAIVALPVKDIGRAWAEPSNRLLTRFYTRCWLFGLYLSSVETLLSPVNPIWFITLQAIFGLLLLSHFRLRRSGACPSPA